MIGEPGSRRRLVVGLTGGIGSGKTAVANIFAELGAGIVDTDAIAHALTAPNGAAIDAIRAAFGPAVLAADGSLDRSAMRNLAFADPAAKQRLEGILHPMIRAESDRQLRASHAPYLIWVVPLLVESNTYRQRVDRVLVVDCPESLQIARVMARSGLTEEQVKTIMAAQATRQRRLAAADDVVMNDAGLADLVPRVRDLHEAYLRYSARL